MQCYIVFQTKTLAHICLCDRRSDEAFKSGEKNVADFNSDNNVSIVYDWSFQGFQSKIAPCEKNGNDYLTQHMKKMQAPRSCSK